MAKEVAKKEESTALSELPEYMKGSAGMGTEDLSSTSLTPPRLKLAQALTPELEDFPELRPGMYFNNVSNEIFSNEMIIVPIRLFESYMLFGPRKSNDGVLARADDAIHWSPSNLEYQHPLLKGVVWKTAKTVAESGLDAFGTSDPSDAQSAPAATFFLNCLCFQAGEHGKGPMIFSFSRSSLKEGKKFAGNIHMSEAAAFGRMFKLTSAKEPGPTGDPYFVPRLQSVGFASEQDFNYGKEIYNIAKAQGVRVDMSSDDANETEQNGSPDGEAPF
jgi:hypothetical protein